MRATQGGESRPVTVDLPETFNWLLGLCVARVARAGGFLTVEGCDPEGKRVLVIWRTLRDPASDNAALNEFFVSRGYHDRPAAEALNRIYVNGDNTLASLKRAEDRWDVLLIEEEFQRLMFADGASLAGGHPNH